MKLLIENLPQRIQEDCMTFPELSLSLGVGLIKALMYIIVFSVSLAMGWNVLYLLALFTFSLIGSLIAKSIAKPLINLNYEQQRIEATYRQELTESVFKRCIFIMLGIAKKQKHLTYFQQTYIQIGVVLPLILIAPIYFHTSMNIGELMRFSSLGNTILDNSNYGIASFGSINKLISCYKRLKEASIL